LNRGNRRLPSHQLSMGGRLSPDGLMMQPSGISERAGTFGQRLVSAIAQHLSFAESKPQNGKFAVFVHDSCAAKMVSSSRYGKACGQSMFYVAKMSPKCRKRHLLSPAWGIVYVRVTR